MPSAPAHANSAVDEDLMLRYAGGHVGSFEMLYERHRGGVFRYLLRHGSGNASEELAHDVWASLIRVRARRPGRPGLPVAKRELGHQIACCNAATTVSSLTIPISRVQRDALAREDRPRLARDARHGSAGGDRRAVLCQRLETD